MAAAATKPKLTRGCQQVLEALEHHNNLVSAQEIFADLRNTDGDAPGLTTVYRSLDSLVGMGIVQAVDFGDGEKRYEMIKEGEHHHHLVCDSCEESVHLDECLVEEFSRSIREKFGFEVHSHVLEIFGRCSKCRNKK